jgi:hypothetical protein
MEYPYYWNWRKWLGERRGMECKLLAVGKMNSALIEFRDGEKYVTLRYGLRKRRDFTSP